MTGQDLMVLYGLAGVACSVAVWRRERALGSALATIPLWPLWAPFVLGTPRPHTTPEEAPPTAPRPRRPAPTGATGSALARIDHALAESVKAVAGSPMSPVFSRQVAQRIEAEVRAVAQRMEELGALASSEGLDLVASAARLESLKASGAPERTLATARLQHDSLVRLAQLRATDGQALDELADLLEALRAQLLVARYAGSPSDGTGAIVSEVWARLEGLGAALEPPTSPT